ncbi:hypothetical protein [Roseitranquillus sediminis]|uniref:hypothetical protein n=1 Tax=Roseitranquillus sediminis TaxID=2809051 RepID=UPI001D0C13B4|nr:hypothetical protein [Roseitranquillus sediminis]MBM9593427.1 hypothetical protein [Roseitranquillus sediminis]
MSAVLIPHPGAGLQRAREVVAHPDFHTDGAVLDACEQLEAWGDWTDAQRPCELRNAIVRDAVAEINRRDRRRRVVRSIGLIGSTLALTALFFGQVL